MKTGICAFLIFNFTIARAQVEWQPGISYRNFEEINYNSNLVYTFNQEPKVLTNHELICYDLKGKYLSTINLEHKSSIKIKKTCTVGTYSVFYFIESNTGTLLVIDQAGKEVKRLSFEDTRSFSYDVFMGPMDNNSFFMARTMKGDKLGYTIEKYDMNLNRAWEYQKIPEKGRNELANAAGGSKGVAVIFGYRKNAFANEVTTSFVYLDENGKEISLTVMTGLPSGGKAYKMKMLSDGSVVVVSDYGKSTSSLYPDIPLGMNIARVSPGGSVTDIRTITFAAMQQKAGPRKEDNTPLYMEAPGLRVLDIDEDNGTVTFVCESYYLRKMVYQPTSQTSVQSTFDSDIVLMDMYLFTLSDAELNNVHRIWKPHRMYQLRNFFSNSIDNVSEELTDHHAFSYQFHKGKDMVIRGFNRNFQYINTVKDKEHFENVAQRIYFGKPLVKNAYPTDMTSVEIKSDALSDMGVFIHNGIVPSNDGFLVYYYNTNTYELYFSFIPNP